MILKVQCLGFHSICLMHVHDFLIRAFFSMAFMSFKQICKKVLVKVYMAFVFCFNQTF